MLLRCENLESLMSQMGQNEKVSQRAFLDRCTTESGHCSARVARQKGARSCHRPFRIDASQNSLIIALSSGVLPPHLATHMNF
jgi:hypothetical protein